MTQAWKIHRLLGRWHSEWPLRDFCDERSAGSQTHQRQHSALMYCLKWGTLNIFHARKLFFSEVGWRIFPRRLCPQAVPAAVWQTAACECSLSERLHICSSYAHWGQQGTGDHKPTSWFAPTPTQQTHALSRWLTLCDNKKRTNADERICVRGRSFQLGKQELAVSHRNFIKTPRVQWEEGNAAILSPDPRYASHKVPHCSWSVNCERA